MAKINNLKVYFFSGVISVFVTLIVFTLSFGSMMREFVHSNYVVMDRVNKIERIINLESVQAVTVTAYSPRVRETDSTPFVNASMQRVAEGQIAVSRDLFKSGWVFGKKVYIEGFGIFTIADLMNKRYEKRLDIFFNHTHKARKFGRKNLVAALLNVDG